MTTNDIPPTTFDQVKHQLVRLASLIFLVALGSVFGTLAVGSRLSVFFNQVAFIKENGYDIGWIIGALAGAALFWQADARVRREGGAKGKHQEPRTEPYRWPGFGKFISSILLLGFVGFLAGVALAIASSIVLVSATSCPLAPDSWQPEMKLEQTNVRRFAEVDLESRRKRTNAVSFNHPWMLPIAVWCIGGGVILGAGVGGFLSFHPSSSSRLDHAER